MATFRMKILEAYASISNTSMNFGNLWNSMDVGSFSDGILDSSQPIVKYLAE